MNRVGSAEGDAVGARPATGSARLVARFYLSMLVIVAIDACFAVIYGVPFERFWPAAVVMTGLMFLGAHLIFRPVRAYLRDPQGVRFPVRRITTLGFLCTAYVAVVVSVLAIAKILLLPSLLDFDIDALLSRNEQIWLPVIHTLYYTALVYFVMADYEATLRERIFAWHGELVPATGGRLVNRLITAFGVTSLLPVGLVVLHALERERIQERGALLEDIAATALALTVCLVFVTRGLLRPIRELEAAMARIQRNDPGVDLPVLGNDETGRLADGFNRMVRGLRERALIRETFGRYVPERVAAAILSNAGRLEPHSGIATILYVDLEGFTAIAEQSSAEQVVDMLNEFFSAAVEVIESNNGVVSQFQGDAMLVTFNLPVADSGHADSALRVGLEILGLCAERRFAGVKLRARVGIATGRVMAGNVGSHRRMSYTVHGTAVNLAARLEQLNKVLGTSVLVDEETVGRLSDLRGLEFVEKVEIRGRAQRVRVYGRHPPEASEASPEAVPRPA
jgi:class 3 adenylate cyclase